MAALQTFLFTSESVNEGHPDKLADQVPNLSMFTRTAVSMLSLCWAPSCWPLRVRELLCMR